MKKRLLVTLLLDNSTKHLEKRMKLFCVGKTSTSRIKEFLRTLPRGRRFPDYLLVKEIEDNGLCVSLRELIDYGENCNWLTRQGKPFKSAHTFATVYNGVWLEEQRKIKRPNILDKQP